MNCNTFKQTNGIRKQQISFTGRLERNEGATMLFINEKPDETTFEFKQNSAAIV